jgi:uncharacterized protein (TIGR00375 family)
MRFIADLHVHSRFSRATSQRVNVEEMARFAAIKGLNLVGTGDFTHPRWIDELQENLTEVPNTGLFRPSKSTNSTCFMITGEVSTIFTFRGETKKIHHVILTPNFETAMQINDRLTRYGDLGVDGRPTLDMTAPHLVEEVMTASSENEVIPAHVWTPWFSLFGAFSGFDKLGDCYQDMKDHIHAIETGLSSDPPMNWRWSALDRFTLVSNSDCHSCWPWRMGREANVFDLEQLSYGEVVDVIRMKDSSRFIYTIETDPAYGKYHWTGHRNCNVSLPPREAMKFGNRCPVCRGRLTKGVEQRIEELADRPAGYRAQNAVGYVHLLPLSEVVAAVLRVSSPNMQGVWEVYDRLIAKFGNEYAVLIDASMGELSRVVDPGIAEAIVRVRQGKARVVPGYDGVYGRLDLLTEGATNVSAGKVAQHSLTEWCGHS